MRRQCEKKSKAQRILFVVLFVGSGFPMLMWAQVPGDANANGAVDIVDALIVAQYYVGLNPANIQLAAADVDGNNAVTIVDALLIAQYYVGIITRFPVTGTPTPTRTQASVTPTPATVTRAAVYLIGDSTVSNYDATLYPRMGWGQKLQSYFNAAYVTITNKAISGRSSKSFYDEGAWTPVKNALQSGDFVFIQFGHNDEKSDDATRYTDPYTTFQQYLSIYIDDARAKGATPVLVTPVHRNNWSGSSISDSHGNYPPAIRDLASKKGVPLIDLHLKSKALFESLGQNYVTYSVFMNLTAGQFANYPNGNTDNTHFQENGADRLCGLIRDGINEQNLSIRSALLK